jgi:hypothetical protein
MIYGTAVFDPNDRSDTPSIRVASIRKITDPKELQELVEFLAELSEARGEHAAHLQQRSLDQQIGEAQ